MAGHRIGPEYSIRHAAVACGVSISTMNRCTRDADGENQRAALALSVSSDEGNESDNPQCETRAIKPLNPDGFAVIYGFYAAKEHPTLDKVPARCIESIDDFPDMSKTSSWKMLRSMGFQCGKTRGITHMMMERHGIVSWRHPYL